MELCKKGERGRKGGVPAPPFPSEWLLTAENCRLWTPLLLPWTLNWAGCRSQNLARVGVWLLIPRLGRSWACCVCFSGQKTSLRGRTQGMMRGSEQKEAFVFLAPAPLDWMDMRSLWTDAWTRPTGKRGGAGYTAPKPWDLLQSPPGSCVSLLTHRGLSGPISLKRFDICGF